MMQKVVITLTDLKKELIDKLMGIWDNADFIIGVVSNAETEDNFRKILNFIENESQSPSDITAYSVALDYETDNNGEYIIGEDGFYVRKVK